MRRRLLYLAGFIAKMNTEFEIWPDDGSSSVWNCAISSNFNAGETSHGINAPSITPLASDSGVCGSGTGTGVAPSAVSILVDWRVAAFARRFL